MLKIKIKISRIRLLYIDLILKPVERLVMVLTGLDRFFGGFLNFKISKRPRLLCLRPRKDEDHGPVFIYFSPVQSPVFYRSLRLDLETLVFNVFGCVLKGFKPASVSTGSKLTNI